MAISEERGEGSATDATLTSADSAGPGSFGLADTNVDRQGGINQGTNETPAMTEEEIARRRKRSAVGDMVDDNAASHQGGMGAQSGQTDFGSAGNLAGGIADGKL